MIRIGDVVRRACTGAGVLLLGTTLFANDYWVDGKGGSATGDGSKAQPWSSIHDAISKIPVPTYPESHRLFVVGDQIYQIQSEIVMKYNVALVGDIVNGRKPHLRAGPSLARIVRYDALTVANRSCELRDLEFEGGNIAVHMGGAPTMRHRPRIENCDFYWQLHAAAVIDVRGSVICDPRFSKCNFVGKYVGIDVSVTGAASLFRPDVVDCLFEGQTSAGYRIVDNAAGQSEVGGIVRDCRFEECRNGIDVVSGTGATKTKLDIRTSSFTRCAADGISLRIALFANTDTLVEGCSFVDQAGHGVRIGGMFAGGDHVAVIRDCMAIRCASGGFVYDFGHAASSGVTADVLSSNNVVYHCGVGIRFATTKNSGVRWDFASDSDRCFAQRTNGIEVLGAGDAASSFEIRSSIVAGNHIGIELATTVAGAVEFCTIADQVDEGIRDSMTSTSNRYSHCVFDQNGKAALSAPATAVCEYSCFDRGKVDGTGNFEGDPALQRPYYVLGFGSPCIDRGLKAAAMGLVDFEGDARDADTAPDLGADESVSIGGAYAYGLPGFGSQSLRPTVRGNKSGVGIGQSVSIEVHGAIDALNRAASGAIILIGLGEAPIGGPLELGPIGAPSSLVQTSLDASAWPIPINVSGAGALSFRLPSESKLRGGVFTAQAMVVHPSANSAGIVLTQGLRLRIGQ
ncbi:MAG: right-handed parallel beta-helix repeat-containing protein [Planctomycetes bacterium]|nr:right-handed parallel beta-helix repeat-containing protein [Planctomycetota bacterium]